VNPREVLLVNPNFMTPPVAPLGLEYTADALERAGFAPVLRDLTFAEDWRKELGDALEASAYGAALVSVRNIDDAFFASRDFVLARTREVVAWIKARSGTPVILGGVGFSTAPCEVLVFTGADYGIIGDGEEGAPVLLRALSSGGEVASVPGIVSCDSRGKARASGFAQADLGALGAPRRGFVDNRRYFREGGQAGIETKRGCGMSCAYCVEPHAKGRALRLRRPEHVVEEVKDLLEQGIDVFHLCDSEFNLPRGHALAVCEALHASGVHHRIRWYTYAYPAPFDGELARVMAQAGCVGINFGVDHLDAQMLRRLGRHYTADDVRRTLEACRNAGITVMCDMLFGAPGETRETLARAIALMQGMAPERVGLSCGVRVYPRTPLARMVREMGPLRDNPHLHGETEENEDFLRPVFYVDGGIGLEIHDYVDTLVSGDTRFLHANPNRREANYNYNDNAVLVEAIRAGERGAYWDILRRISR